MTLTHTLLRVFCMTCYMETLTMTMTTTTMEERLTRIESRLVQLMLYLGANPHGKHDNGEFLDILEGMFNDGEPQNPAPTTSA